MPRVVPSQVVGFISGSVFSEPRDPTLIMQVDAAELSGLLSLIDEIPQELLALDAQSYAAFICAKERVRLELEGSPGHGAGPYLSDLLHGAVSVIGHAMSRCPDEAPTPATSELSFITDVDLRDNLRNDIGAVERALSNGEWKAATVLAGSAIEALLLWDLQNRNSARVAAAVSILVANKAFQRQPPPSLEDWVLHQYIEVTAHLGIIKQDTATEARLAKDFRNLIHPGRAQRLGQTYDRGTALSSAAALEHVVRDLTP